MPTYVSKPKQVEAIELCEFYHNGMPDWLKQAFDSGAVIRNSFGKWSIASLEGTMKANDGDYLVRGVKNELYTCKPDIFKQTYELKRSA